MTEGARSLLVVGGSDSSGGAGIQADLKTLGALGLYGVTAVTSVTAQTKNGIDHRFDLQPETVAAQINAAIGCTDCRTVKIGMLGSTDTTRAVFAALRRHNPNHIVIDPVFTAGAGGTLADDGVPKSILEELPNFTLITPNTLEAATLLDGSINSVAEMESASIRLRSLGAKAVLITGGHLASDAVVDILVTKDGVNRFVSPRLPLNVHGTGCVLSTAIAGFLAGGDSLIDAVDKGTNLTHAAIENAIRLNHDWHVINPPGAKDIS